MRQTARRTAPFTMLLSGFVLWSAAFVVLYAVQATGCRLGWQTVEVAGPVTAQRAVLVGLFLGALALHVVLYRIIGWARPGASGETGDAFAFSGRAGKLLAAAALGASLFCFSGVFWLSAC